MRFIPNDSTGQVEVFTDHDPPGRVNEDTTGKQTSSQRTATQEDGKMETLQGFVLFAVISALGLGCSCGAQSRGAQDGHDASADHITADDIRESGEASVDAATDAKADVRSDAMSEDATDGSGDVAAADDAADAPDCPPQGQMTVSMSLWPYECSIQMMGERDQIVGDPVWVEAYGESVDVGTIWLKFLTEDPGILSSIRNIRIMDAFGVIYGNESVLLRWEGDGAHVPIRTLLRVHPGRPIQLWIVVDLSAFDFGGVSGVTYSVVIPLRDPDGGDGVTAVGAESGECAGRISPALVNQFGEVADLVSLHNHTIARTEMRFSAPAQNHEGAASEEELVLVASLDNAANLGDFDATLRRPVVGVSGEEGVTLSEGRIVRVYVDVVSARTLVALGTLQLWPGDPSNGLLVFTDDEFQDVPIPAAAGRLLFVTMDTRDVLPGGILSANVMISRDARHGSWSDGVSEFDFVCSEAAGNTLFYH